MKNSDFIEMTNYVDGCIKNTLHNEIKTKKNND